MREIQIARVVELFMVAKIFISAPHSDVLWYCLVNICVLTSYAHGGKSRWFIVIGDSHQNMLLDLVSLWAHVLHDILL